MKKIFKLLILCLILINTAFTQNYRTKNGHIWFVSEAPLEKIEAHNKQVVCELNTIDGEFNFTVNMKSFEFVDPDMQEHFNTNYVQSDLYPKAIFKGFSKNLIDIPFYSDSIYKIEIQGALTIHGITKTIRQNGTFKVKHGQVIAKAEFYIFLSDYDINIPPPVVNNINNHIDIIVDVALDKSSTSTASKNEKY